MKHIFTTFLAVLGFVSFTSSQNLQLTDTNGVDITNSTLNITGLSSDFDIKAEQLIEAHNIGSTSIDVRVKRIELVALPGTATAICWSACSLDFAAGVSPILIAPSFAQTILPAALCDLFVLHYKPWMCQWNNLFEKMILFVKSVNKFKILALS